MREKVFYEGATKDKCWCKWREGEGEEGEREEFKGWEEMEGVSIKPCVSYLAYASQARGRQEEGHHPSNGRFLLLTSNPAPRIDTAACWFNNDPGREKPPGPELLGGGGRGSIVVGEVRLEKRKMKKNKKHEVD